MEKVLVEKLFENSKTIPDKIAVIADDGEISYGELWNKIVGYAEKLKGNGIKRGDIIILQSMHTIGFVIAEFAIHLAGGITALIEKDMQRKGIENIVAILNAKAVISTVTMENCLTFDIADVKAIQENYNNEKSDFVFPSLEDCAEIIYTTGTTGESKGVQLSHKAVITVIDNIVKAEDIKADNIGLVPMPLNHVFGLRRYQTGLYCGTTIVLQECLRPIKKFFKALDKYHVTSLSLVPSAISYIFAISKDLLGKYSNQIRYVESSAAPISTDCKRQLHCLLPETKLFSFYGCTESTAACVLEYSNNLESEKCAGKVTVNTQVYILDDTTHELIDTIENTGRVIIRSNANMTGYWDNEETTSKILIDGCIYTNDEGYFGKDGCLYLLGRKDDVINVGGNKIAPEEIEEVVSRFDDIIDCACIGIPNKLTGNEMVLCIKTNQREDKFIFTIKQYLEAHLENYKIPSHIEIVEEIPRTYNGKLQRHKLRDYFRRDENE